MATSLVPDDGYDGDDSRAVQPRWWSGWLKPYEPPVASEDGEDVSFMDPSRVIRIGYVVLIASVIGLAFAALAPLESAILAPGEVTVKSYRKTIQHLEGGTVKQVLVSEGQRVRAGQPLIRLDEVIAAANLSLLQGEADALAAQEARLIAERDGAGRINFPAELLARRSDKTVAAAIAGEERAFRARSSAIGQQIGVLDQRGVENSRSIEGMRKQQVSVREQSTLIRQELATVEKLHGQGYVPITRVLALRRAAADLEGQDGQLSGRIAQMQAGTGEFQLQGLSLRGQNLSDVVKDLREVQTRRFNIMDRVQAARETLTRTTMTAPVDGVVVGLAVHTVGAVIKPGETVMEIVPSNDALQVQARIRPEDADRIRTGMTARINFSSYRQRRMPAVTGEVTNISADRLLDPKGQPFFAALVSVDANALKGREDTRLIPGMPAEVEVNTGARTMLSYLTSPVTRVMRQGMREE